jgi:hypothetical protein
MSRQIDTGHVGRDVLLVIAIMLLLALLAQYGATYHPLGAEVTARIPEVF